MVGFRSPPMTAVFPGGTAPLGALAVMLRCSATAPLA